MFVLAITIGKEAYDDIKRWTRDKEANSQQFEIVTLAVTLLTSLLHSVEFFYHCDCLVLAV